ncbi:hypothetical protein CRUP_038277 [Coryphaenoides rupestris]|nr:hypothetical protein CRUP_038277 [Coryphaenoides rupestris]
MSKLCGHINGEMKKTSYYAIQAFLKQVAFLVAENIEEHKSKLKFFMLKFCSIIKTMDSTHKELSIAIQGYGFFAAIPEVYTPLLERLLVVQIDSYPQYSERMQIACGRAILKDKNPAGSDQMHTDKWKVPSSLDYLNLYRSLLDCDQLKDSGFLDGAFEGQNRALTSLSRLLYDEVIKSVLRIVEKLDLSVQKVTAGEEGQDDGSTMVLESSDPTAHLVPNKVKDFTAFINLVDFCSELLLSRQVEYFEPWVYPLSHQLILHSIRNPLVSGFYKLLAVSMRISKRIQYYQVCLRMKQYKDELLASCLTFALSLHPSMVALDIKAYCPALEVGFTVHLAHPED